MQKNSHDRPLLGLEFAPRLVSLYRANRLSSIGLNCRIGGRSWQPQQK